MQRIYIIGICGTFMGSLALIARQMGYQVAGCDANVYPPMSEQLAQQGVQIDDGYAPAHLAWQPDLVIIGNALSRGNPLVEAVLEADLPYTSGPAWLADHVLGGRHVMAVSGTHGKTTTSSLLAWILRDQGIDAGFLIGGVTPDLGVSGQLGTAKYFVIEADEYDSAFFDKRSKFVHYRPRTLVINNLEYDHADIFPDLAAIQRQFHHLVRTVPANGLIIYPAGDQAVEEALAMGCWSRGSTIALDPQQGDACARLETADGSAFTLVLGARAEIPVRWSQRGRHNVANALAAIVAALEAGVDAEGAAESLSRFNGVSRRLQLVGDAGGVWVFDDFAHHPTAIAAAIAALRSSTDGRLIAVIEPRSNSMRLGVHRAALPAAVSQADRVYWYQAPGVDGDLLSIASSCTPVATVLNDIDALIECVVRERQPGDQVLIMSNGGFGGIHWRLLAALRALN